MFNEDFKLIFVLKDVEGTKISCILAHMKMVLIDRSRGERIILSDFVINVRA